MISDGNRTKFESMGLEAVRIAVQTGKIAGRNLSQANAWIAEQDRSQSRDISARKAAAEQRASDAASRAAAAAERSAAASDRSAAAAERQAIIAERASKIAIAALIVAIISILISIFK